MRTHHTPDKIMRVKFREWFWSQSRKKYTRTRHNWMHRSLLRLNPRILFTALLITTTAQAQLPAAEQQRIANAIYRIEGGAKASKPYGILSVKVTSEPDARRVCLNTINNNWRRWQTAGATNYFGDFIGDRYCPAAADPTGNRNWKRNFRKIVGQIRAQ